MRQTPQVSPEAASERSLTKGLYLHIPFCQWKCNYCDFYSGSFTATDRQRYVDKLCNEIEKWGRLNTCPIDTIYFGGGTPSLLSPSQLKQIIGSVKRHFNVLPDAEITCEVNPGDDNGFIKAAAAVGVNRISVGVQSTNDSELHLLGRRHSFSDAVNTVEYAKDCGIKNISADIMIGLPESDIYSLDKSINSILSLGVQHVSSYILKVEEDTPFGKMNIALPDDDSVADQYLYMSKAFKAAGYEHYEISNFAKEGFQSRHNNKYWRCDEYIGIGPSAHSFINGRRMYYPRDIKAFLDGISPIDDGVGGDAEEYIMLSLRLSRGLVFSEYERKYGDLPARFISKAKHYKGLCTVDSKSISLTDEGMLVSNNIITELIEELV